MRQPIAGGRPPGHCFLFQGREYIRELGIYDYRNRFYYPALGRFIQTDPTGLQIESTKLSAQQTALYAAGDAPATFNASELNLYRYCNNDPVNKSDPFGLDPINVSPEEDAKAQEGLSRSLRFSVANQGFLGIWASEYSTTVFRDPAGKLSLSETQTDGKKDEVHPPKRDGFTSVIETHSHVLDIPCNDTTGSLFSKKDVIRGNQQGRPQYVISRDGKTRQRFRPDDNSARRERNDGGAIEQSDKGRWVPVPGANTDLEHPGAGKNWPSSR